MVKKLDDRIAAAAAKLDQLKAAKRASEARERAKAAQAERAADTRRKILVGSFVLDQASRSPEAAQQLQAQLARYLTRNDDRALFNLPAIEAKP